MNTAQADIQSLRNEAGKPGGQQPFLGILDDFAVFPLAVVAAR